MFGSLSEVFLLSPAETATKNSSFRAVKVFGKEILDAKSPRRNITVNLKVLSAKSDHHQISPCHINAESVVMRIADMITQDEFARRFYQLLPTTSVGNEEGQQMRIHILILGFKGLKQSSIKSFKLCTKIYYFSRNYTFYLLFC